MSSPGQTWANSGAKHTVAPPPPLWPNLCGRSRADFGESRIRRRRGPKCHPPPHGMWRTRRPRSRPRTPLRTGHESRPRIGTGSTPEPDPHRRLDLGSRRNPGSALETVAALQALVLRTPPDPVASVLRSYLYAWCMGARSCHPVEGCTFCSGASLDRHAHYFECGVMRR